VTLRLTTVVYHYVRPADELPGTGYGGLDVEVFERQLDDLSRNATPVGWTAVAAALDGRQELPHDAVLVTFDDGLADHHRHVLPRLVARGLAGLFFPLARTPADGLTVGHRIHVLIATLGADRAHEMIVQRFPDRDRERHGALEEIALAARPDDPEDAWKRPLQRELSRAAAGVLSDLVDEFVGPEDEIAASFYLGERDMLDLTEAGMHLGGHGRDHLWLDFEDRLTVRAELAASISLLERLQPGDWPFAYPYGGAGRSAPAEVSRAGFRAAFTTAERSVGRFRLGRFDGEEIGVTPFADWYPR
jgi:peptidoglycan/xylan/chitin deacetylase (PgdA/CDA1 family)